MEEFYNHIWPKWSLFAGSESTGAELVGHLQAPALILFVSSLLSL